MAALTEMGRPFTRYIDTLYTIRVQMIASYAWLSEEENIMT